MQAYGQKNEIGISEVSINMRQKTDDMRLVADLADAGQVRQAIEFSGTGSSRRDRVVDSRKSLASELPVQEGGMPRRRCRPPAGKDGRKQMT